MIHYKNEEQIELMRHSALQVSKTLTETAKILKPGLKTIDIDGRSSLSGIVVLRTDRVNTSTYAIYPNPARDFITIATTGVSANNNGLISLFDMSGRMLIKQKITTNNQQVSVAALPGGTYFLQLSSSGNILYTQKIIIQK